MPSPENQAVETIPETIDSIGDDGKRMAVSGLLKEMMLNGDYYRQPAAPTIAQEIIEYALEHSDTAYQMASI